MGTDKPSVQFLKLVSFIVQVYAPCWFHIKSHPLATDGARNFHFIIEASQRLEDSVMREAVQRTLTRNSYFAQSENILLAALTDIDADIRRDAAKKTVTARIEMRSKQNIRKFSKGNIMLDFAASSYYRMIDWDKSVVTPPPLLESLSSTELVEMAELGPLSVAQVPCHSQAVERAIKEVTRASTKVFGHVARHGMIVSAEKSRRKHKKLEAKKDFLTDDDQLGDI